MQLALRQDNINMYSQRITLIKSFRLKVPKKGGEKEKREIEVTRTEVPLIPRVDSTIRMIMGTRAGFCVGLHLFNFRD